ncbi:DUF4380 domain-containing protein [Adhaeribacter aquaticus]|uniref:DUF4380 domain-containing protein n=1 Tax=Adhaeribacter aquaticus TaxID=299567 RepID=UPI000404F215|nr:DUF4380 domain-containing protein [Adhaeribacter aquaticus]
MKNFLTISALFLAIGCTAPKKISPAVPENKDGRYSIKVQNQTLEFDPAIGGRITALKLDEVNFFTDNTVNPGNWGSTFWPSPQSNWGWPPLPELDNKPYTATLVNNTVKMVSQKNPKTGLVITKEFSGDKKAGSFRLKYTLTNQADQAQKVAPWEVSRVRGNGISFYPTGQGEKTGGLVSSTLDKNGITWFIYDAAKIPDRNPKLFADGAEGWFAQVNDGYIMVKKFPDMPLASKAPNEGEIEIYTSPAVPGKTYVEIEQQGPYVELQPGASTTWEMTWFLRKLPANIQAEAGNQALVDFARKLAK